MCWARHIEKVAVCFEQRYSMMVALAKTFDCKQILPHLLNWTVKNARVVTPLREAAAFKIQQG